MKKITYLNNTIKLVKISELIDYNIKIPNIQRILNTLKVQQIINYQLEQLKKYNKTNFLGILTINHCLLDNNYYLIDGQHRYESMLQLFNKYSHNIKIFIQIIDVQNFEILKENYNTINYNTPLPEFSIDIDKNLLEKTLYYFTNKYPNVWSNSIKSRRPYINLNNFQESLAYIIEKLDIKNEKNIIDLIENYNKILIKSDFEHFRDITLFQYEKSKKWNFFLGLFNHSTNNLSGYEWVDNIIYDNSNKKKKKKSIPKKLKDDSWNQRIGKNNASAYCLICNIEKIYMNKFEAGHIISEKNGGLLVLDNILPICSPCNKSMGINNMEDWIQKYYPENYSNYIKKIYKIHTKKNFLS